MTAEIWPLVNCVYSHRKTEERLKGTLKVSQYECRLRKSRKSSSVRADNLGGTTSNLNRRPCSTNREAGICNVTMKITREMERKRTVTIEKIGKPGKDSSDATVVTHDIEEFSLEKTRIPVEYSTNREGKELLVCSSFWCFAWSWDSRRIRQIGVGWRRVNDQTGCSEYIDWYAF